MEQIPEFKQSENESKEKVHGEVQEKIKIMVEEGFVPKDESRTQEERQAVWDAHRDQKKAKFDPKNIEQGDLF